MAIEIEMPKLTDTMEDGVLSAWLVDEGEKVSAGDVIAQVETDKATMDVEAFDDGVLLKKMIDEGESVPIGQLIAVLGDEGEDISDLVGGGDGADEEPSTDEAGADAAEDKAAVAKTTEQESSETAAAEPVGDGQVRDREPEPVPAGTDSEGRRIKASPLARRMAQDHGVDLASMDGSGPEGRIVRRDVEARIEEGEAAPAETKAAPTPQTSGEPAFEMPTSVLEEEGELYASENISQMRKTISRRLAQSKYTAPHFYLTVDIDMAKAMEARKQLNALTEKQDGPKISVNDFITKACALALREHPYVNASYLAEEGEIRKYNQVHVGVAVAIDEGLITPVIRNADRKGLGQISKETRELAGRARNRELQPEEFEGSTFTTSNLGMFGIEEFTAIINPPNAAILAIGEIRDVPVVEDGEVVPGKRMKVTLSCDHRVVDGAVGAQFLQDVQGYLEDPMNMLL
ncbi:pyruvate dehydrogenase complex dihydrolipoamide acetyltransferase [Longibacter salinarum]|uniref:Acetyltransferase component of pyruvate dehydrogenase complex n=1 Tax=Longibacter salinarum TaxID=1850348 RepID=A0A2A8D163_9BACT|nr:pyruvate dehydrogenase complex dihydrolipoamide acetyltransferase [Longibacter salinarum]PEN14631.1 pyruvate dehydrogenase complex dihydrolipoamide acetyltransferase [Longibacter salinarum]